MTHTARRTSRILAGAALALMLMASADVPMREAAQDPYDMGTTQVSYDVTPPNVWAELLDAGYVGDPTDGCECLSVAVNTVVDVPGGTWTWTGAEWVGCGDYSTFPDRPCLGTEYIV